MQVIPVISSVFLINSTACVLKALSKPITMPLVNHAMLKTTITKPKDTKCPHSREFAICMNEEDMNEEL